MRLQTKIGEQTGGFPLKFRYFWTGLAPWMATACLGLVFCFSAHVRAEVTVSATVDRDALSPEDTFTYTVSITSDEEVAVGEPELPELNDFEILQQWTGQEARASFVTTPQGPRFETVRVFRFNYMLLPKREGQFTIGSARIIIEGKSYLTKRITVRVEPGASAQARPRGGGRQPPGGVIPPPGLFDDEEDDIFSQLLRRGTIPRGGTKTLPMNPEDAFFIQVETDKTEAYVGEQVTVSWYLYTRGQIRDLDTLKYPSLRGFWKEEIELATHLNFVSEVVNGIPYKKALLASFALFPIKEGSAVIDPYQAKCSVYPPVDAFGNAFGFGKAYTYTKASQAVKVQVKPLPVEDRPADFSGAVGDFQVTADVKENFAVTGQPFEFKIRFEGRGNAKLIDLPPFQPPEGMELYETRKEAKFFPSGMSYKDFSLLMIPRREGDFTIPSLSVSIFDPVQKRYVSKTTEPVMVRVERGQGQNQTSSLTLGGAADEKLEANPKPRLLVEWTEGTRVSSSRQTIGFVGLFGFVFALLFWRARTELGFGQRKKDLLRALKSRMRRVRDKVDSGDWRAVGVEMTNTVYFVLGAVSGEGGANVELEKLLLKAPPSVRREIAEPLTKQMETFQILTFAPDEVVGRLKEREQLKKAVQQMQELMEKAVALGVSSGRSGESE